MTNPTMAARFGRNTHVIRSDRPLAEDQMRAAAPSIFAEGKHASRSERYTYIPTIDVLRGLRREGFEPFMAAQGRSRVEGKSEYTKHMVRLRHASQAVGRSEANEIILINSHDGASSYQLACGAFRYICHNGLVVGNITEDIRVKHKGDAGREVIEGAIRVLQDFEAVDASTDAMKAIALTPDEETAFANAALTLRYGLAVEGQPPAPVTAAQVTQARRPEDVGGSLWLAFQRIQESLIRGGLQGRTANGRRMRTREVASIDRNLGLNRALWVLAEEMRRLKA